jgi:phosphoribosylaminoimidazole-succinocarboxamide synthase
MGKVRDSYDLPGHPDLMLVVVSNRISIFDFVLNAIVPFKGEILNAMSIFWMKSVIEQICKTDLVAFGIYIDGYLPEHLRGNADLQRRAVVVKKLTPPDVEDIVRIHLTGSGWKSYQKDSTVCGHRLPNGLKDGSLLPYPIYAPTTKAVEGHDEHISADSVAGKYGVFRERLALQVAGAVANFARQKGIILADTKFEIAVDPANADLVLADEKATPDSSRFWDAIAWQKAMKTGKLPPSFDKQFVRDWLETSGWNKQLPAPKVPTDIIEKTAEKYHKALQLLMDA